MKYCKSCLLPEAVPGSNINLQGVCSLCCAAPSNGVTAKSQLGYRVDLEDTLRSIRDRSGSGYDCLVPLSGGKDSLYLLYKLKVEYGLKVLAFTSDINLPELAWCHIRTALHKLDIDPIDRACVLSQTF